jgi:hypothetical protein
MKRRDVMALIASAATWPMVARAAAGPRTEGRRALARRGSRRRVALLRLSADGFG